MEEDKKTTPTTDDGQPPTDDVPLKNEQPVNNENTNINTNSNETIKAAQRVTTNEKQETRNEGIHNSELITQNMEVHHHTHPAHGKKTWKTYSWEFVMLFLAVFCGFLAEYFLEHTIEKEKNKQYLQSLYEDLKTDTARMTYIINIDNEKIDAFKNILSCYDTVSKNWRETSCMAELVKYSKTNKSFHITDRTLTQLTNAGGFRLLSREDADSILSYESSFRGYLNFESTVFQGTQDNVRNTLNMLADFRVNLAMQVTTPLQGIDTSQARLSGPLLFSDDKPLLNKWFNELALYVRVIKGQRNILNDLKIKATGLIEYYKTKHHLY